MAQHDPKPETVTNVGSAVRGLARDAQELLTNLGAADRDLESLLTRIESARAALGHRGHDPVRRWLDNLRQEVQAARIPTLTA